MRELQYHLEISMEILYHIQLNQIKILGIEEDMALMILILLQWVKKDIVQDQM